MILLKTKNANALMLIGMLALLLANVLNFTLHWADPRSERVIMAAMGMFYGISFVTLLVSVRMKASRNR